MGKGKAKTSPMAIEADERQVQAVNLRKAGLGFEAIARQLGYASASGAYAAVRAGLDKALKEPADELRAVMLARLDEMLAVAWEGALGGDVDSVMLVLRIEERRARLLGLERREAPLSVKLPKLERAEDAPRLVSSLLAGAASGELLPDEAGKLAGLAAAFTKAAETADLAERIRRLEEMAASGPAGVGAPPAPEPGRVNGGNGESDNPEQERKE